MKECSGHDKTLLSRLLYRAREIASDPDRYMPDTNYKTGEMKKRTEAHINAIKKCWNVRAETLQEHLDQV